MAGKKTLVNQTCILVPIPIRVKIKLKEVQLKRKEKITLHSLMVEALEKGLEYLIQNNLQLLEEVKHDAVNAEPITVSNEMNLKIVELQELTDAIRKADIIIQLMNISIKQNLV